MIADMGGIQAILSAMHAHQDEEPVQAVCCDTLSTLAELGRNAVLIDLEGGLEPVLRAMRRFPDRQDLRIKAFGLLLHLAWADGIVESGAIETVVSSMLRHKTDDLLQFMGCKFFCYLAKGRRDNVVRIGQLGGFHALAKADQEHPNDDLVQMGVRTTILTFTCASVEYLLNHRGDKQSSVPKQPKQKKRRCA
jgi:hypothetical protein